ncbi:unnamed protein product [Schistocephalus solidus]|uniref:Protein kinase domain-containing protein n=1 Tax=Schistocephalus solidus TaxID=70667 RepID=A0A183SR70_SCHSO|nr:unnamed protein product [Schistocephalus solidus]
MQTQPGPSGSSTAFMWNADVKGCLDCKAAALNWLWRTQVASDGECSTADRRSRTESTSRQFLGEVIFNIPDGLKTVEFSPTGISSSFEDRRKGAVVPSIIANSLIKKIVNATAVLRPDEYEIPLLKALTILTSMDFPSSEAQPLVNLRQSLQANLFEHVLLRSACHLDAGQRVFALKELVCNLAVIEPGAVLECLGLQELETVP